MIEPSESGIPRFSWDCKLIQILRMDFRKVNAFFKGDAYPMPILNGCIDNIGKAMYVTNVDLVKVFWQIRLSERAKDMSAFVLLDGL